MNYKMTVTIANPKTPDGMSSDLTMNLKCGFSIDHRTPYGNKTYLLITDEQHNHELLLDLRYDTTYNPEKKVEWLEQWARGYWNGKNGAYAVKSLSVTEA